MKASVRSFVLSVALLQILFFSSLSALSLTESDGSIKEPAKKLLSLFEITPTVSKEELLAQIQEKWQQENKERWQMEQLFEDKKERALPLLKEIGFVDTVYATGSHYKYALVLGAVGTTMQRRLDFLYEEWKRGIRFDHIVLLSGQRDLNPQVEEVPEGLKTETELFVYLFNHHPLKNIAPCTVIDSLKETNVDATGAVSIRRPNTKKTLEDWLSSHPEPGPCLAISTQPFVGYQEAVVRYILPLSFSVEGVGPGAHQGYPYVQQDIKFAPGKKPYPLAIYLDSFARWYYYNSLEKNN